MAEIGVLLNDRYEILKELGHDEMSELYLVADRRTKQQWTIKEVRKSAFDADNEFVDGGLQPETELSDRPLMSRVVDVFEDDSSIYVVTDCTSDKTQGANKAIPYKALKRILDCFFGIILSVVLSPLLLIVALLVYLDDPGPVLFRQYRIGLGGQLFKIYKFRTMMQTAPAYQPSRELRSGVYYTRFGRFLRKYSLDELPQLINILKGDMSIIGPRPLIANEKRIHRLRMETGVYSIRPGITGLAQVNGKDALSTEEKLRFDISYVRDISLRMDIWVLLQTAPQMLRGNRKSDKKAQQSVEA